MLDIPGRTTAEQDVRLPWNEGPIDASGYEDGVFDNIRDDIPEEFNDERATYPMDTHLEGAKIKRLFFDGISKCCELEFSTINSGSVMPNSYSKSRQSLVINMDEACTPGKGGINNGKACLVARGCGDNSDRHYERDMPAMLSRLANEKKDWNLDVTAEELFNGKVPRMDVSVDFNALANLNPNKNLALTKKFDLTEHDAPGVTIGNIRAGLSDIAAGAYLLNSRDGADSARSRAYNVSGGDLDTIGEAYWDELTDQMRDAYTRGIPYDYYDDEGRHLSGTASLKDYGFTGAYVGNLHIIAMEGEPKDGPIPLDKFMEIMGEEFRKKWPDRYGDGTEQAKNLASTLGASFSIQALKTPGGKTVTTVGAAMESILSLRPEDIYANVVIAEPRNLFYKFSPEKTYGEEACKNATAMASYATHSIRTGGNGNQTAIDERYSAYRAEEFLEAIEQYNEERYDEQEAVNPSHAAPENANSDSPGKQHNKIAKGSSEWAALKSSCKEDTPIYKDAMGYEYDRTL